MRDLSEVFRAHDGDSARDVHMATIGVQFAGTWPTVAAPLSTNAKGAFLHSREQHAAFFQDPAFIQVAYCNRNAPPCC